MRQVKLHAHAFFVSLWVLALQCAAMCDIAISCGSQNGLAAFVSAQFFMHITSKNWRLISERKILVAALPSAPSLGINFVGKSIYGFFVPNVGSLIPVGGMVPAAGAMIDALLGLVQWTKSTLGEGPPTRGDQYQGVADRLGRVASRLGEAVTAASWEGLSGVLFFVEIKCLIEAAQIIREGDELVAHVLNVQSAEVMMARDQLAYIEEGLMELRSTVIDLVAIGHVMGAAAAEQAGVAYARNRYRRTIDDLRSYSETHANRINDGNERLVEVIEGGVGTGSESITVWSVLSSSSTGNTVCVTPSELTGMADSLENCAIALKSEISVGQKILVEVRATHGRSGYAEIFDLALAKRTISHNQAISELSAKCDAQAITLREMVARYDGCDAAVAERITGAGVGGCDIS